MVGFYGLVDGIKMEMKGRMYNKTREADTKKERFTNIVTIILVTFFGKNVQGFA